MARARVMYQRLTEEGERRLASVFRGYRAEREKLSDVLAELDRTAPENRR